MLRTMGRILLAVMVVAFCLPDRVSDCAAVEEPSIRMAENEYTLILAKEQKEAQ